MLKWPKIILVVLILISVWTVSLSVSHHILFEAFICIYVAVSLPFFIYVIKDINVINRLLLLQSGAIYISFPFIFEIAAFSMYREMSPLLFIILSSFGILINLTSLRSYLKMRSEAKYLYPHVFSTR